MPYAAKGIGLRQTTQVPPDTSEPDSAPDGDPEPDAVPGEIEPDVRFSFANERTFLAWVRTSLGLVTAGLVFTQLFPKFDFPGGRRLIGLPLIALGVLIAVFSYSTWQQNERAMRTQRPLPKSRLPQIVAVVVSAVAILALVLALFDPSKS